ncbi:GAF domain-containing protein, partial [Salmonella enterica]|uniref:GAF domain-containing protein n=1 Tax=Salmonella enterica TaxID=28901 RepID=UPI003D2D0FC1
AFLREPVIVADIANDPRWTEFKDAALALGLLSCWSSPIFDEAGRVVGTFALSRTEARAPTGEEQAIVDACTYLCSIALE